MNIIVLRRKDKFKNQIYPESWQGHNKLLHVVMTSKEEYNADDQRQKSHSFI